MDMHVQSVYANPCIWSCYATPPPPTPLNPGRKTAGKCYNQYKMQAIENLIGKKGWRSEMQTGVGGGGERERGGGVIVIIKVRAGDIMQYAWPVECSHFYLI
jgi:hypothetical protein